MPLYDFKCSNGHTTEELLREKLPSITCACGAEAFVKVVMISKTAARWGSTALGGTAVSPVYDRGLGAYYSTSQERDRICKEKGLVPLADFGESDTVIEDNIEKQKTDIKKNDAYLEAYDKVYAETKLMTKSHDAGLAAKEAIN